MTVPNYRNIYRVKNKLGTPKEECRCEYCHEVLTDENRSRISNMIITLEFQLYQLCKGCRRRFFGQVDDSTMLKWAYQIARKKELKK